MLFGRPCARPFPPYFVQYLHPVGFFFFSLILYRPLLVRLLSLQDVVLFCLREDGGVVIATWTGRGSGDCIAFLLHLVYAVPFVVLVPRCP